MCAGLEGLKLDFSSYGRLGTLSWQLHERTGLSLSVCLKFLNCCSQWQIVLCDFFLQRTIFTIAQCMFWGKFQGCSFVNTRCGVRRNDAAVTLAAGESCDRTYSYDGSTESRIDCKLSGAIDILTRYCQSPNCDQQWPVANTPETTVRSNPSSSLRRLRFG